MWVITRKATQKAQKQTKPKKKKKNRPRKANKETDRIREEKKKRIPRWKKGLERWFYLGVKHDSTENTGVFHGSFEIVEGFLVVVVRSMRKVEASDVHACFEKLF